MLDSVLCDVERNQPRMTTARLSIDFPESLQEFVTVTLQFPDARQDPSDEHHDHHIAT